MLYKVEVEELFGVFTHSITFKEGGITIILGENGLGKTVILKMLKSFFDHNFHELGNNEFKELRFYFEGELEVRINKLIVDEYTELQFALFEGEKRSETFMFDCRPRNSQSKMVRYLNESPRQVSMFKQFDTDEYMEELRRYLPSHLVPRDRDTWYNMRTDRYLTTMQAVEKFSRFLPPKFRDLFSSRLSRETPNWLIDITGPVNAKLVETQRLLISLEEDKYRNTVLKFSKQMVETIANYRSVAIDTASKLDRTYTNRLIDQFSSDNKINQELLMWGLSELQGKRKFLNEVGLLNIDEEYIQPLNKTIFNRPELHGVLQIYIEDSTQKLSVYDELAKKIKIFLDIINKRFKNKKLSINRREGFEFSSTVKDKKIPLSGLSSGEQHLIVLFFELIFNTDDKSLILIDEPEISLHIIWQKEFIQDLREILKLNDLRVLIATHSPDIIGNFWNLSTSLKYSNYQL